MVVLVSKRSIANPASPVNAADEHPTYLSCWVNTGAGGAGGCLLGIVQEFCEKEDKQILGLLVKDSLTI